MQVDLDLLRRCIGFPNIDPAISFFDQLKASALWEPHPSIRFFPLLGKNATFARRNRQLIIMKQGSDGSFLTVVSFS